MTVARTHVLDTKVLRTLGISEAEERAYVILLMRRTATVGDVAHDLGVPSRSARQLLTRIEAMGLATHTPRSPKLYIAAEPEFAIDALIKQRQVALEQARAAVPILTERFGQAAGGHHPRPMLELITNHEYLNLVVAKMFKSFRSELMLFQTAPTLVPTAHTEGELPRGATARIISDRTFLEAPGSMEKLRVDLARGEQERTFLVLPFKMMIVDRSAAIVTLDAHSPQTAPTLLVHQGALLEALCLLFEFVWEHATPILSLRPGTLKVVNGSSGSMEPAGALVPLLSAGLNDKAIAQELQISASTLNRRIGDLMHAFGARTRFQLGMQIAMSGNTQRSRRSKRPS